MYLLLAVLLLFTGCTARSAEAEPAAEVLPAESAVPEDGPRRLDLGDPGSQTPGVSRSGSVVTVEEAGTYEVAGVLDGRLAVDADGPVELILAGAEITGPECLKVLSGGPVTVTLAEGASNVLSDGAAEPDSRARAALYSKAPLTIRGEGVLSVRAGAKNGIQCKSTLTVAGGTVIVSAPNSGLKAAGRLFVTGGKLRVYAGVGLKAKASRLYPGSVSVTGGDIMLQTTGRGIDAENAAELGGGVLRIFSENDGIRADTADIFGGELAIDAGTDGIQAAALLRVEDGVVDIRAAGGGGDAIKHPGESFGPWAQSRTSTAAVTGGKGLKSDGSILITGGSISLDTADDAVHCAEVFTMEGGELTITATDDAVHADDMLVVSGGALRIDDCFEGLEAFAIEIRGGDVVIRAVNDGINANGSYWNNADFTSVSGYSLTYFWQSGGNVDIVVTGSTQNQGDGVDSNGSVYVSGGVLTVSTYGSFMENGLDTGWGGPVVYGGMVMAGGSSAMAESFGSASTQCCAVVTTSYMPDGTEVTITDEDGNVIWSVVMADAFSCLQLSHPDLQEGHVYTLTYGSQSTTLDFTTTTNISRSRGFGGPGRPF